MDTSSPRSLPDLARSIRPWALGAAVAVALGFHFFLSHAPMGWSLGLFALIVTAGIIVITQQTRGLRNRWALWFLVPIFAACISATLYSSQVVQGVSFCLIAGSLAALAYWLTAPTVRLQDGISLWKPSVFIQSALPFRNYQLLFTDGNGARRLNTKLVFQIITGLLIAGPLLLIFLGLFTQGDRYFSEVLGNWLMLDNISDQVVRLFFDVIVVLFSVGFFWRVAQRSKEEAAPSKAPTPFEEIVSARTFLFAIATLFVMFACFQLFYLFQNASYLLAQGHTYAEYAVSGYQQLCIAAALAFLVLLIVYRLTGMHDRWIRYAGLTIAATSIISTLSAAKRLWLYVDAYGLTLSRSWGMLFLVLVILLFVLLIVCLAKRLNLLQLITSGSALTLGLLSFVLLFNHEAMVANYNLVRHAENKGPQLDLAYLVYELSPDAVPTIKNALSSSTWNSNRVNPIELNYSYSGSNGFTGADLAEWNQFSARDRVFQYWKRTLLPDIKSRDLRQLTVSSIQAERAIESIPPLK